MHSARPVHRTPWYPVKYTMSVTSPQSRSLSHTIPQWHSILLSLALALLSFKGIGRQRRIAEYWALICQLGRDINGYMNPGERGYSDDLITILSRWEFPDHQTAQITDSKVDQHGRLVHNYTLVPDLRYLVDTVLPLARRKVRKYRRPGGVMADDWYR